MMPHSRPALRTATVPAFAAVPGLVHGFERRLGPSGWETRADSRRRVAAALEPDGRLYLLRQVHGSTVVQVPWEREPDADASAASSPRQFLGIETADCLPVLIVDPRRRVVAAAHAGWRGTAAAVGVRAVEALVAGGSRPDDLLVALGPAIGPCCYEVGEELRSTFEPAFFRPGPRGRPHLDVRAVNRTQLTGAGVPADQITAIDDCTFCHADDYHSYRREGKGAGRMINFVGFRD